jgi:hypothetical protein
MVDEYATYKVSHIVNLLSTVEGKKILEGYINLKGRITKNQDLIFSLQEALDHLKIKWHDWSNFFDQGTKWDWSINEKKKGGEKQFKFVEARSGYKYKGKAENIHKNLIAHARLGYNFNNYYRFNTRSLIGYTEAGVSNFYFRECKAPLADGLARFMVKSRVGIQFTPKRKLDILNQDDDMCGC